jgi:hypothetical protein
MSFQILSLNWTELDFKFSHFDPVLGFASDWADLKSCPVFIVGFEILLQGFSTVDENCRVEIYILIASTDKLFS